MKYREVESLINHHAKSLARGSDGRKGAQAWYQGRLASLAAQPAEG